MVAKSGQTRRIVAPVFHGFESHPSPQKFSCLAQLGEASPLQGGGRQFNPDSSYTRNSFHMGKLVLDNNKIAFDYMYAPYEARYFVYSDTNGEHDNDTEIFELLEKGKIPTKENKNLNCFASLASLIGGKAGPDLWTDLICLFHHHLYRDRIPPGKRSTGDRPVCQRRECEHDRIGSTVDIGLLFYQWFHGGALVSGCLAGKTYPCAWKDILDCSYRFGFWKHACGCHVYHSRPDAPFCLHCHWTWNRQRIRDAQDG